MEVTGKLVNHPYTIVDELLPVLHRLDLLLEGAIKRAEALYGKEAGVDLYRGFYIDQGEVTRLLSQGPGTPAFSHNGLEHELSAPVLDDQHSRLAWLQAMFDLTPFEMDLLIIAIAPELDRRYERLYAYLQDDVSHRRPRVDLALNLLCTTTVEKVIRRSHFAPEAPLIGKHLLHLIADDDDPLTPLLAHALKVDEQIVTLLLGQQTLDPRLASFCHYAMPEDGDEELTVMLQVREPLSILVADAWEQEKTLRLYFQGPRGNRKCATAKALAAAVSAPFLEVDLAQALVADPHFEWVPRLIFREVRFHRSLLYLHDLDVLLCAQQQGNWQRLVTAMSEENGITILAGSGPWPSTERTSTGAITIPFDLPGYVERQIHWQEQLACAGWTLPDAEIETLASRFWLTPTQITEAVASGTKLAQWRVAKQAQGASPLGATITLEDLFMAARAQTGHDLAALAQKIEPVYQWDDLVLPEDSLVQLRDICQRVEQQQRVLEEWGFGQKLTRGKGITALFAGASGTGKTMAAEIIANALGLDLYRIDLSSVVSKYIGETEKNLERIFSAASRANAILFFDEADALFGKRSEVKDAHDRYANIEISYLLQRMEEYEGVVILATNLRNNLDSAFVRRIAFIIHFPQPDEEDRLRIWQTVWPSAVPLSPDLDLPFMARQFKLSGGNIKNIALAAAFSAASANEAVSMHHLMTAARRELQKMGKTPVPQDFGLYSHLLYS